MTAPVPPPVTPGPRGVRRSRTGAVLGGVCTGVARSAGLDPLLLRVAVAAMTLLTGGAAALAYLVAWVLIPREPVDVAPLPAWPDGVGAAAGAGSGAGTPVRTAWATAGNDLRSLAAELRRPVPPTTAGPGGAPATGLGFDAATAEAASGPVAADAPPGPVAADAPPGPVAADAPPDGAVPAPRSPIDAADDAATALGERLRAPEVQAGARKAAVSVSEAVTASVDELGRRLRRDPG